MGKSPALAISRLGLALALLPSTSLGFLLRDMGVLTVPTPWDYGENS